MNHHESPTRPPRLRGAADLLWLAFIVACFAVATTMLVRHLETEFDAWRLANRLAMEVAESERLQQSERQLRVELEVRTSETARPATGTRLGLMPAPSDRVLTVELP